MGEPAGAVVTLLGPTQVRALARELGLRPTKVLGQNFVVDPNTIRRIVRAAGLDASDVVVEVGPGFGSLTLGLIGEVALVYGVEVDARLAAALPATVRSLAPAFAQRLRVCHRDALSLRAGDFDAPLPTALVANLPYNVAVPVVLHLLAEFTSLRQGLVMVQREVADRLTAAPGSKAYGAPTVKLAWYAHVRPIGRVPPAVFWPAPRVDSGLVAFSRRPPPGQAGRDSVFAVIDAAFGQRRKTLRASLAGWAGGAERAASLVAAAGIDPGLRAENLVVGQYAAIAAVAQQR